MNLGHIKNETVTLFLFFLFQKMYGNSIKLNNGSHNQSSLYLAQIFKRGRKSAYTATARVF